MKILIILFILCLTINAHGADMYHKKMREKFNSLTTLQFKNYKKELMKTVIKGEGTVSDISIKEIPLSNFGKKKTPANLKKRGYELYINSSKGERYFLLFDKNTSFSAQLNKLEKTSKVVFTGKISRIRENGFITYIYPVKSLKVVISRKEVIKQDIERIKNKRKRELKLRMNGCMVTELNDCSRSFGDTIDSYKKLQEYDKN